MMNTFSQLLVSYLIRRDELCSVGASEDTIRDGFLSFLRTAFPRLSLSEPIELEKYVPALRVRGGFVDALYGDLIFEFKRALNETSRIEGKDALVRYIRNQTHPERFFGLLTDGSTLEVYTLRDGGVKLVDQIRFNVERADDAKLWLDCYLFHQKNLVPTANDVALRFGERSPTFWQSLRLLEELWRAESRRSPVQTKYIEWQSLLSIVYGSAIGDERLFLRHTYLAVFARVLAFVAIERRAPNNGELGGILNGTTFKQVGFDNFAGDDFFTWLDGPSSSAQVRSLLHAVATRITAAYDLARIHEDLLKELYQELVDPQTRHDLGEFYTPDWLAEMALREAGFPNEFRLPEKPSLLDPSCGSGTFLFTAVRLLRESGMRSETLVDFCAANLAGVDVHPLAVTIAKTNLLLALSEDLRGYQKQFALPIYMADSLTVVEHDGTTLGAEIEIGVDVRQIGERVGKDRPPKVRQAFGIPAALADQPGILTSAFDALLEYSNPDLDESNAVSGFISALNQLGIPSCQEHQWRANLDLMRWLLRPPPTNGVWRFILQNAYQPELLSRRKFDFVAGNPPWLSYRYIQRPDYQQRIRRLVLEYRLQKPKQTHLVTQMELATLFFAFCAKRYLKKSGVLAFVMPRSILTGAKQHVEFQKRYMHSCRVVIDCEQVEPLFNVPACAVIWTDPSQRPRSGSASPKAADCPRRTLSGSLTTRNASYTDAQARLTVQDESYTPLQKGEASPYLTQVIQGASLVPRSLWFVRPPPAARIIDQRRPHLETDPAVERQGKKPWKDIRLKGRVEIDFLFATLLSSNMVPFGWRELSLVVLPLEQEANEDSVVLDEDDAIRRGKAGLYHWLRQARQTWDKCRKSKEDLLDYLDWQGKLSRQRSNDITKTLYGMGGTHLCACVVDLKNTNPLAIHELSTAGFVADTTTYWLDSRTQGEAHYLCAFLNAQSVDMAIKPHQTKGAFGAMKGGGQRHIHRRPFEIIPIPRYSRSDPRHRELARLSRRCHKMVDIELDDADEGIRTMPIGRLRTQIRSEWLAAQMEHIDSLVKEILKGSASTRANACSADRMSDSSQHQRSES